MQNQKPDPWPESDIRSLNRLISRLVKSDFVDEALNGQSYSVATLDALVKTKLNELLDVLQSLTAPVREKCVLELNKNERFLYPEKVNNVLASLREVIGSRNSKTIENERLRSTIISAACGPHVSLKAVSRVFGIYDDNYNHYKLEKYRKRREAYMSGKVDNLDGDRYPSKNYGFPSEVLDLVGEFFESPECGTPDK